MGAQKTGAESFGYAEVAAGRIYAAGRRVRAFGAGTGGFLRLGAARCAARARRLHCGGVCALSYHARCVARRIASRRVRHK